MFHKFLVGHANYGHCIQSAIFFLFLKNNTITANFECTEFAIFCICCILVSIPVSSDLASTFTKFEIGHFTVVCLVTWL